MSEGRHVAAFFDVDHTLLSVNSGRLWLRRGWRDGRLGPLWALRSALWLLRYRFGSLDMQAAAGRVAERYAGIDTGALADDVRGWFARELLPRVTCGGRDSVADHLGRGHTVALLTSGTRFVAGPLAEELGIDHVLCTRLEERDGTLTGRLIPPVCMGPGKLVLAQAFAEDHGLDLDRSFFYTDSHTDLPLLERVGNPRVINPDPRLRRLATRRGWTIRRWAS